MALSRQMLKAMGIEDEKIDQIIESHSETVSGLKELADKFREQAEKVPDLEKKVEELSNVPDEGEEWKAKYDEEHEKFEAFKEEVEAKRQAAEKRDLYAKLLRESGIDEKRIDSILKVTDLGSLEVQDGLLSDADALAEKAKEEWADFIVQKRTEGAKVDDPPTKEKEDAFDSMPLAEKMQYANEHPSDAAVKAWLGN